MLICIDISWLDLLVNALIYGDYRSGPSIASDGRTTSRYMKIQTFDDSGHRRDDG